MRTPNYSKLFKIIQIRRERRDGRQTAAGPANWVASFWVFFSFFFFLFFAFSAKPTMAIDRRWLARPARPPHRPAGDISPPPAPPVGATRSLLLLLLLLLLLHLLFLFRFVPFHFVATDRDEASFCASFSTFPESAKKKTR